MAVKVTTNRYHKDGDVTEVKTFDEGTHFGFLQEKDTSPVLLVRKGATAIAAFNSWDSVEVV